MKFNPATDIPDLSGKVVLVTGGNVGIGASIVKGLAQHNAHIFIAARRTSSAETLVNEIHETHPKSRISVLHLDLKSLDSVKKCAESFNNQSERLDLLFLNAGVAGVPSALTDEGYEMQFGVNHVGHQLLTQLLMPKLLHTTKEPGADVRIMLTSSVAGHQVGNGLSLDQMHNPDALSSGMQRYGHSKLANMLFARKLAQVYPSITTTSHHPGVVKTEIWGKATGLPILKVLSAPVVWMIGITCEQGAIPGLWTATAKKGKDGVENGRCYYPGLSPKDNKVSVSQKLTDELWDWTNDELAHHGGPGWPQAAL